MALRTPLYDWHVARKARLVEFGGWDMPIQYTTITDEHQAVRTSAGLFDISHMGRLAFQGPDAGAFLQHVFTNDVEGMKPGQVRYGLVCNEQGGILDDVLVYRLDTFWLMVVNASNRAKVVRWFEARRGTYSVQMVDETAAWGMVAIQGPRARQLVEALAPAAVKLKYYYATAGTTAPGHVRIWSRTGYTGEDGWEVIVPAADLPGLVENLFDSVAPQAGVELKPCGLGARDTLRLEAAMPLYGHELGEDVDPFQAGLGWAVKLNKGEFLGKPALEAHAGTAPRSVRVGLELQGKRIAREGTPLFAGGREVGRVTSGTFSPTLNKSIAMAYVEPGLGAAGTALEADVRGRREPATVVPLPFYQRAKS